MDTEARDPSGPPESSLNSELVPAADPHADHAFSARAAAIGLGVSLLCAIVWPYLYFHHYAPSPRNYLSLMVVSVFGLVCLLTLALRLVKVRLRRGELVSIFATLLITMSSFYAVQFLFGMLPSGNYYHSAETKFEQRFLRGVPPHLLPFKTVRLDGDRPEVQQEIADEKDRMEVFYRGIPKPSASEANGPADGEWWWRYRAKLKRGGRSDQTVWDSWKGPIFWWSLLLALLYVVQFSMALILRRQWIQNEKLMFPHAQIISQLAGAVADPGPGSLLRNRVFWIGAGLSGFIFTLEALNHYHPNVPFLDIRGLSLAEYLGGTVWQSMNPQLSIQPYMLAISYLLPAEMSLSIWVFAVIDQFSRVVASGFPREVRYAWTHYRINSGSDSFGAVIVFILALLWTGRRQLRDVFVGAFGLGKSPRGTDLEYRLAVFGLVGGTVGVLWWCVYAGMSFWISAFLFGVMFMVFVYVSRCVSELGVIGASHAYLLPHRVLMRIVGYQHETMMPTYAVFSYMWGPLVWTGYLMPNVFTGLKLAGESDRPRWRLIAVTGAGLLLTTGVFIYMTLWHTYETGALNSKNGSYNVTKWIFENYLIRDIMLKDRSHAPDATHLQFMGIGAGVMAFLLAMRHFFHWWPLHPIGYIVSGLDQGIWFSFFLGWVIKRQLLKYGGGNLLTKVTPLFLGLFVGQFAVAAVMLVVGYIVGDMKFNVVEYRV